MKKKVFVTILTMMFLGGSFPAFGAPQYMADGAVFDAQWYREQYPDINAAFPVDAPPEVLYEHYTAFGVKEGRLPFEGATAQGGAEQGSPSGPGESSEPGNPSGPGVPSDPGELSGQGNPSDPGNSTGQGNPAEPGYPTEPGNSVEGTATDGTLAAGTGEEAAQETQGRVIDPSRPMVALTFDDGPYAPVGNQIMDCLAQYGGKATFYVVGNRCASYRDEMQRMVAEGHEIGNHTYSHKYLQKLGAAEIQSQIQKGSEAIQAAAGVAPATVRLPGGNKNATVLANVNAPMIMWNIDTLDWKTRNTQSTVNAVLGNIKDGDIVLMHELYAATGNAAVQIIPALTQQGYQLVTVSELAQYRGGLENGKLYYSFRP